MWPPICLHLLIPLLAVTSQKTNRGWCIAMTLFWKSLSCTSFMFRLVTHSTLVPSPLPPPSSSALFFFLAWRLSAPSAYFVIKICPPSIICTQLLSAAALTSAPQASCCIMFSSLLPAICPSPFLAEIYYWVSRDGRLHGLQLCCRQTAGGGSKKFSFTGGHLIYTFGFLSQLTKVAAATKWCGPLHSHRYTRVYIQSTD